MFSDLGISEFYAGNSSPSTGESVSFLVADPIVIDLKINGESVRALLDTGATISCMPEKMAKDLELVPIKIPPLTLNEFNGSVAVDKAAQTIFEFGQGSGIIHKQPILIVGSAKMPVLLGRDIMAKIGVKCDFQSGEITAVGEEGTRVTIGRYEKKLELLYPAPFYYQLSSCSNVKRDDNGLSLDSPVLTSLVAGLSSSLERSVSVHLAEALFLKTNHFLDISTFVENLDCPSSLLINVIKKLSGKIHLVKKKINSRDRMVKIVNISNKVIKIPSGHKIAYGKVIGPCEVKMEQVEGFFGGEEKGFIINDKLSKAQTGELLEF